MQRLRRNHLIALVLLLPAQLFGEGYTVQSTVDTQFQGGLGSIVGFASRMSGHSLRNVATTTYLQGHQMRTDNGTSGMIYDLDAERIITLDHKQKTYSSMTFAEMSAAMEKARAEAEKSRAKEEAKAKAHPDADKNKDKVNMKYHVTVDRPKQAPVKILSYDTDLVYLTISVEAENAPEGKKAEQVGSMVLLIEQHMATGVPLEQAYAEFNRLFAQKLGREFHSQAQGLQAAFASDPRLKEGMEAAAAEMQKIKGISLKSVTYASIVPPNTTFDRQVALNEFGEAAAATAKSDEVAKTEKPKSKFGGFMSALKTAAEDAGRQRDRGNQKTDEPAKQTNLLVMSDQKTGISVGAVPATMFAPPEGYREVKSKAL